MGTRGSWGFRVGGKDKLAYNHFDSYPEGLGVDIVGAIRGVDIATLREQAAALRLVDDDTPPTPEDVARCTAAGFADFRVDGGPSRPGGPSWYQILRRAQGGVAETLGLGVMLGANDFVLDSLFCEWAYIVNVDDGVLEVYRGFQRDPHDKGRYASDRSFIECDEAERGGQPRSVGTYYPCALIGTLPLGDLPEPERLDAIVERMLGREPESDEDTDTEET